MDDLISRQALLAEYDRVHVGPSGGARKLMEDAPSVEAVTKEDVLGWLLAYHTMSFDLKGQYCPHEVIGWLVADISKNLFADMREENNG
mgnify:CR=1 FL=1